MALRISEIKTEAELEKILPLIAGYQRFYKVEPNESNNRKHFASLLENRELGVQYAAYSEDGMPIGFATLYFPLSSVSATKYCLLNDLYSMPEARRKGVGEALIKHCVTAAGERGFSSIEWQTQAENTTAHGLYNRIPGASSTTWLTYHVPCR